jgi:S-adenosylhomocysteine hydrolase
MKAIIIGGGSIGKRHSTNLNKFGVKTRIVDIDEIDNIDNILNEGFDMGLVCTPNIIHIEYCFSE